MGCLAPYQPINTLKAIADDLWIVDGPEITMAFPWFKALGAPFTTRMTVIRLPDGGLWIHSPTPITDSLANELNGIGRVNALVAPNRLHYSWIPDWTKRYPSAATYAAPGMDAKAAEHCGGFTETLGATAPSSWQGAFDQVLVPGDFMTEVVFFHRASRTLILTDLIENFEPRRISCLPLRWLCRASGCCDPDGKMPFDLRYTFRRHRDAMRDAVRRMIALEPERIILAHGRWYPGRAVDELKRAFRWL